MNGAPTAVALNNTTASLFENTNTSSRIKVADIAISDDAIGTNTISLLSADAASFEVDGNSLYLKAGVALNYETKSAYGVTISVRDTSVSGSTAVSTAYSLAVSDVNEAPTAIALNITRASLAENTNTSSRIKVADIGISDDALGSNTISLLGADAASFEVDGNGLYLKAGVALNYETKSAYGVTVSVRDTSISASSAVTTTYSLAVTDQNEAPTVVALTNTTASLAENTNTSSRIKVADIGISDDALGSNTILLLGADAASFEVDGNVLYLKAGVALNYETKSAYGVTISVRDNTISGSTAVSTAYSLAVSDVNEAPTAVAFTNLTRSLATNTNTSSRIKVADIAISDDALVSNTISLLGADAASFEVDGTSLYFKAGVVLNYESKPAYSVSVSASDSSLAGSTPVTATFNLSVTDVNGAPTAVALSNTTVSLPESTKTTNRIKVADIAISDDAIGTNTISLLGADAGSFEVDGNGLYLKAGVALNYETKSAYGVTISVKDNTISGSAAVSTAYSLAVTDVNEAPTIVALNNTTASLAENTNTSSSIKVADIAISDDILGSSTISLQGADAGSFEVVGNSLYLKAGEPLNYETKSAYGVTISVKDNTISGSTAVTTAYTLYVTDLNKATDPVRVGTTGNDSTLPGESTIPGFDGFLDTVFTGAGDDEIDIATTGGGDNRIFAGSGADVIYAGSRDVITGGSGDDILEATEGDGNRLSGGRGDDDFIIGSSGNRALGGEGNDVFKILEGAGTNYLNGGAGSDEFRLVSGPGDFAAKQFVMDFKAGEDQVGLFGLSFDDLSFTQVGGDTLLGVVGTGKALGHFMNVSAGVLDNQANFLFG